ncbi:MAG: YceI family protein [Erythrobacter sp.]|uniref:YceI family protein n=1 Tax=Erythrobacter sp. TaxID=1042 RepID=UPI0032ED156D
MNRIATTAILIFAPGLLALAACAGETEAPPPANTGEWQVVPDASRLTYVSVKSGEVLETNRFTGLSGSVSESGTATVTIDLSSLETGVDIRNERMRDLFFEISDYPTATVTAAIDPEAFAELEIGETTAQPLAATLSLKGIEGRFDTQVDVTRTAPDRVVAMSSEPVIVYAEDFGLGPNIEQLREIAGLPSITPAVPVTFALTFERAQ